jgi:excinuclease ABC subunit C
MMKGHKLIRWEKENTKKPVVPNKPGVYKFYRKDGKLLYVGVANKLRHRVQSYMQKDCFKTHPTKATLRPKIHRYVYKVMPLKDARKIEHKLKGKARYNKL